MKLLAPLIITGSLAINAHAVTVFADLGGNLRTMTQTLTQSLSFAPSSFIYNEFNPSLGTLTGISLSIEESNDSGSFSVTAINANARVRNPTNLITFTDNQASGGNYTSSTTSLLTTPGTVGIALNTGHLIVAGNTQTYTLTNTSLIGSTPVTRDLSGFLGAYTGTDTVSFNANITPVITVQGSSQSRDLNNWSNNTKVSLIYTYVIPEPSSPLLAGLGALALLRRRRA